MPEGVVVALEAVEVEEHDDGRRDGLAAESPLEVGEELASIAEARQCVGGRLVARQLEEPAVLAEGPDQSYDDEEQGRGRERDGQDVHGPEVVVHEDPGRDHRTHRRHREEWAPLDLQPVARVVRQPGGRCDEEHRGRPQHVDPGAGHVGARRRLEEVDGVGGGGREEPKPEHEPAIPRSPASQGEDAEDGGEQENVTERVGDVRGDRGRRPLRRLEDELDDHCRPERRGGQCRRESVEPERVGQRPDVRTQQEDHADVQERVERDEPDIGRRRGALGLEDRVPEFAERPADERERDHGPRSPLARHEIGVGACDDTGEDQQPDVEPDFDEVG